MFAYAVLPAAAQVFIYGRVRLSTENTSVSGGVTQALSQLLLLSVIGILGLVLASRVREIRLSLWLLVYLGPWAALLLSSFVVENRISYSAAILPAVGLVIGLSARRMDALRTIGYLTAGLAAVAIATGVLLPGGSLFVQSALTEKSLIGDKLLAGPLLHPNALGQTLALGLPFVALIARKWWRWAGYTVTVFALLWAGSRTALVAAAIGIVIIAIFRWKNSGGAVGPALAPLALIAAIFAVLVTSPILVATSNPSSFTDRGIIWSASLKFWERHEWMGNGPRFYSDVTSITKLFGTNAYHGHNLGVHLLATGGMLGVLALAVLFIRMSAQSWKFGTQGVYSLAAFSVIFMVICWLEVPTDLATFATLSWIAWVPIAIIVRGASAEPGLVVDPRPVEAKFLPTA